METLAAALPIIDIIKQPRARGVAAYPQDEAAIGTGDRFGRHFGRSSSRVGRTAREHTEMGDPWHPRFGGDMGCLPRGCRRWVSLQLSTFAREKIRLTLECGGAVER